MDQIPPSDEHEAHRAKNSLKVVPFRKLAPSSEKEFDNTGKLSALRDQLVSRRRSIIIAAAEANTIPSYSSIRQIAEIQIAIAAIEAVEDEYISP